MPENGERGTDIKRFPLSFNYELLIIKYETEIV
jgi:hypothetical protein